MPQWAPDEHLEQAVHTVLTGADDAVAATVQQTALLLATTGFAAESDRVVRGWQRHHDDVLPNVAGHALARRAWAMLWHARGSRPAWAEAVEPVDLDSEECQHRRRLASDEATTSPPRPPPEQPGGPDLLRAGLSESRGGSPIRALELLETFLAGPEPRRDVDAQTVSASTLLAGELAAGQGDRHTARAFVARWVEYAVAGGRPPDVYTLASCRQLASLLVEGAVAGELDIDAGWARRCADELTTAIDTRYAAGEDPGSGIRGWPELVAAIVAARAELDHPELDTQPAPAPATPEQVRACTRRVGGALPDDYRAFLGAADGLPADAAFPALLGSDQVAPLCAAGEQTAVGFIRDALGYDAAERAIQISEISDLGALLLIAPASPGQQWAAVEHDWLIGCTGHPTFRRLMEQHLEILRRLGG